MIDKVIDRWIKWRYCRWDVRIAEQWKRRLRGDDRFEVSE